MKAQSLLAQTLAAYRVPVQFAPQPEQIDLVADEGRLSLSLHSLDQVGCAFEQLTLASDRLAAAGPDELRKLAENLAARIRYLLEPIAPVELDKEMCVVQLRSNPPQHDDTASTYYEMLAQRGGQVSLVRYRKDRGQVRQVIPAQVTREVLVRLAGDLAAAIQGV